MRFKLVIYYFCATWRRNGCCKRTDNCICLHLAARPIACCREPGYETGSAVKLSFAKAEVKKPSIWKVDNDEEDEFDLIDEDELLDDGDKKKPDPETLRGDAFRCSSCPYLGMPAFKPGEKVQLGGNLLNSDI